MPVKINKKRTPLAESPDINTNKEINFDPVEHRYEVDGKCYTSVTQALPDIPSHLKYKQFFIDKTILGSRVHKLTEVSDRMGARKVSKKIIKNAERELKKEFPTDWKITELDLAYLEGWYNFLKETKWKSTDIEVRLFCEKFEFAGTVDRVGTSLIYFNGKKTILDIKTVVKVSPTVALQTAGYLLAYNMAWPDTKAEGRLAVQLNEHGEYKVHVYAYDMYAYDKNVFLAKTISRRWDIENKIADDDL